MGPDRLPRTERKNIFQKYGRPLAAAVLAVASHTACEQSTPNPDPLSTPQSQTVLELPQDFLKAQSEKLITVPNYPKPGELSILDLQSLPLQSFEIEIADLNPKPPVFLAQPDQKPLLEIAPAVRPAPRATAVQFPRSQTPAEPQQAPAQPQNTDGILAILTGYYCQQVPGYPVMDGGGFCGKTRSGLPVAPGIAACGTNWRLGTQIEIEGVGTFLCADTGHLAPNQVDIFYQTNKELIEAPRPAKAIVREVR